MTSPTQAYEIVVCGLRPEASLGHLVTLVLFVVFAWRLSPARSTRSVHSRY
jgi:hypothetical protein